MHGKGQGSSQGRHSISLEVDVRERNSRRGSEGPHEPLSQVRGLPQEDVVAAEVEGGEQPAQDADGRLEQVHVSIDGQVQALGNPVASLER